MLIHSSSSQRGQSLLEYAVILALVISGILIGGPLLMNAVNSHFRLLDDATQDSLTEQIQSGATAENPVLPTDDCSCQAWVPITGNAGCGDNAGCSSKSRKSTRTCTPEGCDTEQKCVSDPGCCTALIEMSCGTLLPSGFSTTECPTRATINAKMSPRLPSSGSFQPTCEDKTGADTLQCAIGERKVRVECGTDPTATTSTPNIFYACQTDEHCLPNCSPYILTHASDCHSGTSANTTPRSDLIAEMVKRKTLPSSSLRPTRSVKVFNTAETEFDVSAVQLPYAFVQSNANCTSNRYCEASCEQDPSDPNTVYVPSSDGTMCKAAFCQETARSSFGKNYDEFNSSELPYKTDFDVTILANQHYIFACLDENGNITEQQGTAELQNNTACPISNERTLNGRDYCISDPITTPITADTFVSCTDRADQLYLRVWTEGATTTPGYSRLIYTKCTSFTPSPKMALDNNAISACGTKMKVVTDPNVYRDNCDNAEGWYAYAPSIGIPDYFLGCRKPQCTGNDCYFVYCE